MRKRMAGWSAKMIVWPRHKKREYVAVSRHHGLLFSGFFPVTYPDK